MKQKRVFILMFCILLAGIFIAYQIELFALGSSLETNSNEQISAVPYLVKDINTGESSGVGFLAADDGNLFFHTAKPRAIWYTDGTLQNTTFITGTNELFVWELLNDNMFYFAADLLNVGVELWKTDGTITNTKLVKDINPSYENSIVRYSPDPTVFEDVLYFEANDGIHGAELWRSDGTDDGTYMVKDIRPGEDSSNLDRLSTAVGILYFTANDGIHGTELWRSDGTNDGTYMVKDINSEGSSFSGYYYSYYHTSTVGEILYFTANDGIHGVELWRSNGTNDGTYMVKDIFPGVARSNPKYLSTIGETLYFTAEDALRGHNSLWRSDGTDAGTYIVKEGIYPRNLLATTEGLLYFQAKDIHGRELWRSDGTNVGTYMVKDIYPGEDDSNPYYLTDAQGIVYFAAKDGTHVWLRI